MQTRQYAVQDFFRNPQRAFFRLSDDGARLAFMEPVSIDGAPARMNIFVQALQGSEPTGEARRLTAETERDIAQFFWKGSDTVIYAKDFNGDENFHVIAVDIETGETKDLTPFPGVRASIEDDLEDDPDHILLSHNGRNPEVFDVYRADIRSGELTLVASNPGNIVAWQTDHQGLVRAAIASDGLDTVLLYRDGE
jgi:Tol biopolymer transport system component